MAHYLYVLQSVTLNLLEPRMRTPLDFYNQVSHNMTSQTQRENISCCCWTFLWLVWLRKGQTHRMKNMCSIVLLPNQLLVGLKYSKTLKDVHSTSISVVNIHLFICFVPLSLQDQREKLHSLRQAAFEAESENSLSNERRRSLCAKEFKKLGFSVSDCHRTIFCNVSVHYHHDYKYS